MKSELPFEFNNLKKRSLPPAKLIPESKGSKEEEEVKAFFLTLALASNDIKGFVLIHDIILRACRRPDPKEISEHRGELEGLKIQLTRLMLSEIHEILSYLEIKQDIFQNTAVQKILQETSRETRLLWIFLMDIATGNRTPGVKSAEYESWRHLLVQLRNNVGFHYQTDGRLIEGYRRFFFNKDALIQEEGQAAAYYSGRKTSAMESRFYFADAALQGYMGKLMGGSEADRINYVDKSITIASHIGRAINDLMFEYLQTIPR